MTHADFNELLGRIDSLSPEQVRKLRRQLDCQDARPKKCPASAASRTAKHAEAEPPKRKMTEAEFAQHLLEIGLISSLPDAALDVDDNDPDDQPVTIEGEPLSETIIRERR